MINTKIQDFYFSVDQDSIEDYNCAVKNENEEFVGDHVQKMHALYFTRISWQIIENLNDLLEYKIDPEILKTIVHQSEHLIFLKQLPIPSEITVKSQIWSIAPHNKGTKMQIRFDYYFDDELFATEFAGGLMFGVKCLGKAMDKGKKTQADKINERPIWKEHIEIDENLPYLFAQKAKIDAPIHTNPQFAKSIGLDDIILQGTCTFAKSINLILAKEYGYKSTQIKGVSAKFTGMVIPPNALTVRLLKKEKKSLYFDVYNNENQAVIKGGQIIIY